MNKDSHVHNNYIETYEEEEKAAAEPAEAIRVAIESFIVDWVLIIKN